MKPFNEHGTQTPPDMAPGEYALHGDVIIERIGNLPENFGELPVEELSALAYGEVTGHVHQLQGTPGVDFDVRINPTTKERFLSIVNPTLLKHQEHSPILLRPGQYRTGVQREYDPFEQLIRSVAD